MLVAPWNVALTIIFTATGIYCLVRLFLDRSRQGHSPGARFDATVVHFTHAIMSGAMIAMCWVMAIPAALNWAQILLFSALAVALIPFLRKAPETSRRIDLLGHIWLGAAMVWMIAAMPLLMSGAGGGSEGSADHHVSGEAMKMVMTTTPIWVDLVNALFVAGSLAMTLWWLYGALTNRGQRLHLLFHCLMAAGMAAMLLLMNA